jgi:hypothetical protein
MAVEGIKENGSVEKKCKKKKYRLNPLNQNVKTDLRCLLLRLAKIQFFAEQVIPNKSDQGGNNIAESVGPEFTTYINDKTNNSGPLKEPELYSTILIKHAMTLILLDRHRGVS